ncbi:hypothetical protein QBC37DRAFT_453065 [Rhypophila decipiens]|uniref:Zn(2)-C6 fungal-type domain-containing protein n=1 Tax=Rhypophila decipiens TaxID=261697 RepID=A0AAN6YEB1_9PEZI|nr:hypothetical protein QBC37DRAFT_453065 [Rhypophila decipiens]
MADQQLESDPAPQRKRIAVACGRCRKRKIRCSGDPGNGTACSNCKNAGVDECLFLRVQSREAPMRVEPGDFYSNVDARMFANRAPVNTSLSYAQELPTMSSSDVVASYRGAAYPPYTTSKQYYPAYGGPYQDEFEYGLGVSSQSVMGQDCMHPLMPGHWGSATHHSRVKAPSAAESGYGNIMLAADPSPYAHAYAPAPSGSSLVHRPAHGVNSEHNNFSFTGVAASLPSTSSTERILPNPIQLGRASTLPYPGPHGSLKTPASVSTTPNPTGSLADVAATASYAGSFDTSPGLPYVSSTSSSMGTSHQNSSSVTRSFSSDTYSAASSEGRGGGGGGGGESIFGEQERSLQSQGSGFDLNTYTAEPRRDSTSTGAHSGSTLSNGHTYVPSDGGAHEVHSIHPVVTGTSASHHHASATQPVAAYAVLDSPTATSGPHHGQNGGHRQSQGHQSHHLHHHQTLAHSPISGGRGGNTTHADTRAAVGSRR